MKMKTPKLTLITLLTIMVINATAQTKNYIDQPYIDVTASADTLVTPNQIYIRIIIAEKDTRDRIPLEEQEAKMITALKALGINTEINLVVSDILSNYYTYFIKKRDVVKSKEYVLKVTDAATASKAFVALEDNDIANSNILRTEHTDIEKLKNDCRNKAILKAYNKAKALTLPIQQDIAKAIYIQDIEVGIDNQLQGRVSGLLIRGINSYDKTKYETPKIEFEKIKVSASVAVKFILK